MAVIKTTEYIKGIHGKVSKNDDYYYSTNSSSGTISKKQINIDPNKPPTEVQKASRSSFREKTQILSAWFKANGRSDSQPEGTPLYQEYRTAFKSQHEVGDMYHYVWRMLFPLQKEVT